MLRGDAQIYVSARARYGLKNLSFFLLKCQSEMTHRLFIAVMALLFVQSGSARSAHELWKFKLTGEGGIQRFDRPRDLLWLAQQGIVFLSPERVLIYRVNRRREPAPLAARTASGGGGNFILVARIFDVKTGVEIKRLQFVTTTDFSSIAPTHDGKFIVRVGGLLALYDADFHPLVARKMLQGTDATLDYWQISVTPSGKQVALVHQHRFGEMKDGIGFVAGKSEADVEVLNADTFQVLKTFHLPYYLPIFSAQEHFLLTTAPHKPMTETEFGVMDFTGQWTALHPAWDSGHHCVYNIDLLEHDLMAARGCGQLVVFSPSGEKFLTVPTMAGEYFMSVTGGSRYLAVLTGAYGIPTFGGAHSQPISIDLYDLGSREKAASLRVHTAVVDYALSAEGLLGVVDGDEVRLYQTD